MTRIRIHRSDGKTGSYSQSVGTRQAILVERLHPERIFSSGHIVIGVHNPFTILNPDDVCWVEIETLQSTVIILPEGVDEMRLLNNRQEFEQLLADHWPIWRKANRGEPGDMLEALVELMMRGGECIYLQVIGKVTDASLVDAIFGMHAITARSKPAITAYVNPKCITRARIYHSRAQVSFPDGCWVAEADDI